MNMENLIKLREEHKLKGYQMAKIIGVSDVNYSRYERGTRIFPLDKLNIIANKYDCSLDYLSGIVKINSTKFNKIDIDYNNISQRLKKLRVNNNLTQDAMAKKLHVGRSTISDYEKLNIKPSITVLIEYSCIFNVTLDYICGKTD